MKRPYIPNGCDQQAHQPTGRTNPQPVDDDMQSVLSIMTSPVAVVSVVAALVMILANIQGVPW